MTLPAFPDSPEGVGEALKRQGYFADTKTALAVFLCQALNKSLLIEGPAGVGKTELAKAVSGLSGVPLIRLQCYEGLDAQNAIYDWNYRRQFLRIKLLEKTVLEKDGLSPEVAESSLYAPEFLLKRPLLQAITSDAGSVLLIDELDRADEEFESYLLEILSDWQITIPETGTITAKTIPFTVITGNRVRDISDAVRRRCFYLWLDYPQPEHEAEIIAAKVPESSAVLTDQIVRFIAEIRKINFEKKPGVAESIEWAKTLSVLHYDRLDPAIVEQTLGVILKDRRDVETATMSLAQLFERVGIASTIVGRNQT